MPSFPVFLLFSVLALMAWMWWSGQGCRVVALEAARRICNERQFQLLDESVAIKNLWFKRNARGQLSFWRSYVFEYSTSGDERFRGQVVVLGMQVEAVQLETEWLH